MKIKINIRQTEQPVPPPHVFDGWRVLHKIEGGSQATPPGMPEVTPPLDYTRVTMTEAIQRLSFALMQKLNPTITANNWTRVHDYDRAFNNGMGFRDPTDLRANYITGENLAKPLPGYDKAQRVCGGSFITGVVEGDYLVCTAGVDGIDPDHLPSVDEIIAKHWYIPAVSVNSDFTVISHFPQGNGGIVAVPFIFYGTIRFPLAYLEAWNDKEAPDPLRFY